jgi:hypothetical protein
VHNRIALFSKVDGDQNVLVGHGFTPYKVIDGFIMAVLSADDRLLPAR